MTEFYVGDHQGPPNIVVARCLYKKRTLVTKMAEIVTNTFRLQYTSPTPVSNIDLTDLGTLELFLTIEMVYIEVVL